jgi:hypothetical protein
MDQSLRWRRGHEKSRVFFPRSKKYGILANAVEFYGRTWKKYGILARRVEFYGRMTKGRYSCQACRILRARMDHDAVVVSSRHRRLWQEKFLLPPIKQTRVQQPITLHGSRRITNRQFLFGEVSTQFCSQKRDKVLPIQPHRYIRTDFSCAYWRRCNILYPNPTWSVQRVNMLYCS